MGIQSNGMRKTVLKVNSRLCLTQSIIQRTVETNSCKLPRLAISSDAARKCFIGRKKSLCVTFELTAYAQPSRYFDGFYVLSLILEKKSSVGDSLFSPSVLAADNRRR